MRANLIGWVMLGGALSVACAQSSPAKLQFSLDRPAPLSVQYTITVSDDGSGQYVSHLPSTPDAPAASSESEPKAIHVSPAVVKKLFTAVPMVEGGRCETHNKNIAKTGVKVLHYTGAGRDAQCTFNYSDDDRVNDATAAFEGLAETLQFGDRLRSKLRFDRLGLDNELDGLLNAVTGQRALEVGNIAPVLKNIVDDERVMDRARRKAERLLEGNADPAQASTGEGASLR